MRVSRLKTLSVTGIFHKVWKGHNREYILAENAEKQNYLRALFETFVDEFKESVQFHGFCLMGNHTHEVGRALPKEDGGLKGSVKTLGKWMRNAHSRFGYGYNVRHKRQGKVAYDRPKTPEIKNEYDVLKTMFYCDANPVKAGMVAHPANYKHSSYRFYAYGEKSAYTEHLTPPPAYLAGGKNAEQRRRKYRRLCDLYLRLQGLLNDRPDETVEVPGTLSDFEALLYSINIRGAPLTL